MAKFNVQMYDLNDNLICSKFIKTELSDGVDKCRNAFNIAFDYVHDVLGYEYGQVGELNCRIIRR